MKKAIANLALLALIGVCIYAILVLTGVASLNKSYTEFLPILQSGMITSAVMTGASVEYTLGTWMTYETVVPNGMIDTVVNTIQNNGATISFEQPSVGAGMGSMFLLSIIPVLLLIGAMFYLANKSIKGQGGAINGMGKSKGRWVTAEENKIRMADVAIVDNEYKEILQLVNYLKNPDEVTAAGGRLPHGFLMSGPPGVGKTLIAKAIAGESGVSFYEVSGSAFDEMLVGAGASRVRDMFEEAKKNAPCIIFIDEIDAVAKDRSIGFGKDSGQTVGQLLTEMDGFTDRDGVVVIAATNRPDMLDPAILRPGRFDRHVTLSLPDLAGRKKILDVTLGKVTPDETVDLGEIARGTTYFSGADLANLVNEAALAAGTDGRDKISQEDLHNARDVIIMGVVSEKDMPEHERELTAYHEAGHAIVGHAMPDHDPVYKVSIIPRGRALGVTAYLPDQERFSQSLERLESNICSLLGGRLAEEMIFGEHKVTTGASNDLERATDLARRMVNQWGFSDIGVMNVDGDSSEHTKRRADEEVERLLNRSMERAKAILDEKKDVLEDMAQALLEKETLDKEDINQILGD